eukprot:14168932-Alexandrium_andersonii.AAC.1
MEVAPWIFDSGASFHVATPRDIDPLLGIYAPIKRRAIVPPARIATANGGALVREEVMVKVPTLGSRIWAK